MDVVGTSCGWPCGSIIGSWGFVSHALAASPAMPMLISASRFRNLSIGGVEDGDYLSVTIV